MDELIGYLIAFIAILFLVALVVIYVILPLLTVIAFAGALYGGYFAVANYALAFKEVTIEGNKR